MIDRSHSQIEAHAYNTHTPGANTKFASQLFKTLRETEGTHAPWCIWKDCDTCPDSIGCLFIFVILLVIHNHTNTVKYGDVMYMNAHLKHVANQFKTYCSNIHF